MVNSETSIQLSSNIMSSNNNDAASAETNNDRNVRQRVNPSGLESLPDAPLANIASFLSHTTRALFSSALSAPSSSYDLGGHNENEKDTMAKKIKEFAKESGWEPANDNSLSDMLSSAIAAGQLKKINNNPQHQKLSKASKIVLSNPYHKLDTRYYNMRYKYDEDWKELDLLDLDKSLRMRLTDGDIAGILVCIDAVNNLQEIKLPHCMNIRGDGLSPLKGSVVLKKVDLSIVSEEVDRITPKISIDAVLPIFDSIMAKNQNSMKRLHVPKVWRDSHSERLNNFYLENHVFPRVGGPKYEHMSEREKRAQYLLDHPNPWNHMCTRKMDCEECCSEFQYYSRDSDPLYITCEGGELETCPEPNCGKKYCTDHHADYQIKKCHVCEKKKCRDCSEIYDCQLCARDLCGDCVENLECCGNCDYSWERSNCIDCMASAIRRGIPDGEIWTKKCGQCGDAFCAECEPDMDHLGENVCQACRR